MPPSSTPLEAIKDDPDDLVFLAEPQASSLDAPAPQAVWRVLIVDDDEDVHTTTTFALGNLEMQQRPLQFLHAYSAAEARALLAREKDIAVVLLDVVMEEDDAGLHLVRFIRDTLKLADVRIILRTGQPGYAPEIDAIRDFDINDYKTKSELTRIKLYTTVTAAIRSYQQICDISRSRSGLDRVVRASAELMRLQGVPDFAAGVLTQVGQILGSEADGVLCVRNAAPAAESADGAAPQFPVIACAGSYQALAGGALTAQADGSAVALSGIGEALAARANVYTASAATLYFNGKSGRDFAAFIPLAQPLGDIEKRLLDVFAGTVAVGLENVKLVRHLHTAAFYDQLSKLPNRTRLIEILDLTLASPARETAILSLVDLDHFAETNDALGHQFGDLLLAAVAARLQSCQNRNLTVARIGGDIFSVLGDAELVNPQHILSLFARPFSIDGQDVRVSATMGLVRLSEHDGSGADALKDADIALKRAKVQQRTGHFYFSRSMGVEIRERVRMMHALRTGFANNELFLAYQPQVDLVSRRAVGAEALLRWRMNDGAGGTLVSPAVFIPIAEYSGLIIEIGEFVLRSACQELVRLRDCGHRDFTMSVNVSQVQFRHPLFLQMLKSALDDSGAPPQFVELEITESMAMEEPQLLIEMLAEVKRTGVSIAIDDFGTGFSSLSYLQRLQIDRLKIDRAFVTEITQSARGSSIAEMVIQLGRNLGLSVVAEGVEDERQAQILQVLGCPIGQGFLFARPMPPEELNAWLLENTPA
jgi:diguanylate cyclase (GGDEF)-like protein